MEPVTQELIPNPLQCAHCAFIGKSVNGLEMHIYRMHTNTEQYKKQFDPLTCEKCGRICKGKAGLAKHAKTCNQVNPDNGNTRVKCVLCNKDPGGEFWFENKVFLKAHMERVHNSVDETESTSIPVSVSVSNDVLDSLRKISRSDFISEMTVKFSRNPDQRTLPSVSVEPVTTQ